MDAWQVTTIAARAQEAFAGENWLMAGAYLAGAMGGTVAAVSLMGLILIYAERKVAAHFQCRLGPMRVGWHGILQPIADGIKLFIKEDIIPAEADRLLYFLAPFFCIMGTFLAILVLPASPFVQLIDLNVGVIFLAAVSGFGVFGVLLGGWSSNNKWSMLGAMRAGAQMVSYEISLTLSLLVVVLFSGSLKMSEIVASQAQGWWIWRAHGVGLIAFMVFVIASVAELNRAPFDLSEGESELTGGFHTEYSGLRFALFFLAEFINMFLASAFAATFFLGGWMPFHIGDWAAFNGVMDVIPPAVWFLAKTSFLVFVIMWFRWTFPRLRVDQLMALEWKVLLPVSLVNLFVGAVVVLSGFYFFS
ncbi:MAG: NADH-quinone oxidoreductase subunit NuoH [Bdellovibrionaceae bacterium]|nr:NADH-quinone oxidoreductase subunit NuoH [Bdellovibrionales bacterium]MCB9083796.1 NADH-quinone oxidoreductase subunit NuoH [Pseudobdellovibrionaceae bacterium]